MKQNEPRKCGIFQAILYVFARLLIVTVIILITMLIINIFHRSNHFVKYTASFAAYFSYSNSCRIFSRRLMKKTQRHAEIFTYVPNPMMILKAKIFVRIYIPLLITLIFLSIFILYYFPQETVIYSIIDGFFCC